MNMCCKKSMNYIAFRKLQRIYIYIHMCMYARVYHIFCNYLYTFRRVVYDVHIEITSWTANIL